MATLYAQDAPNWQCRVPEQDSVGDLMGILYKLGAQKVAIGYQKMRGQRTLIVRFEWPEDSEMYRRFDFVPLSIRPPRHARSDWEPTELQVEYARRQMARRAVHLLKQLVSFFASLPQLMTGFLEVPGLPATEDGMARTLGELETNPDFRKALPFERKTNGE